MTYVPDGIYGVDGGQAVTNMKWYTFITGGAVEVLNCPEHIDCPEVENFDLKKKSPSLANIYKYFILEENLVFITLPRVK